MATVPRTRCVARVAVSLLCLCAALRAQGAFERVLPGNTVAFVGVDSVAQLKADWAASATGRLLADPECQALCRHVEQRFDVWRKQAAVELGADPLELLKFLAGPVALALTLDVAPGTVAGESSPLPTVFLLADVGEHQEECAALLRQLQAQLFLHAADLVVAHQSIDGAELTTITRRPPPLVASVSASAAPATADANRVIDDATLQAAALAAEPELVLSYGFRGSVLVICAGSGPQVAPAATRLVGALAGRPPGAVLADQQSFRDSLASAGKGVRAWADAGRLVRLLLDAEAPEVTSATSPESRRADLPGALGLRDIGAFSQRCTNDEQGSEWSVRLDWPGEGWIPRLLRKLCRSGDPALLELVPADCRSAELMNFDAGGIFDDAVRMLIDLDVMSPADVVDALGSSEEFLGFNPREDLLDLLDGRLAFTTCGVDAEDALPGTGFDPVNVALLIGLEDGAEFGALIDRLVRSTGFHAARTRESWRDLQIDHVSIVPPIALHYAILDDLLVASLSSELLHDILERRLSPELPDLRDAPEFRAAAARLPADIGMLGYTDTAASIESLIKTLKSLPELLAGITAGQGAAALGGLDWLAELPLPGPDVARRHLHGATLACLRIDEHGLLLRSIGP